MSDSSTVMNLLPQDKPLREDSEVKSSWKNIVIWILGIFVSAIPVFLVPFVKLGVDGKNNTWFTDIFNNCEVLIISVCLAVPVLFHALTKKTKKHQNWAFILSVVIFIFTVYSIAVYCTVAGMTLFAEMTNSETQPKYQLGWINFLFLLIMFLLGFTSLMLESKREN